MGTSSVHNMKPKLKQVQGKKVMSITEAQDMLDHKKALFIIEPPIDLSGLRGYIAYVSPSSETLSELVAKYHNAQRNNMNAILIGSYEDGGAIGVQYII